MHEYPEPLTWVMLSQISQILYCRRRAALMGLYEEWSDNIHTTQGSLQHDHVDRVHDISRAGQKTVYSFHLESESLGLKGIADMVEFTASDDGVYIPEWDGKYVIEPVEFKHGRRRDELEYEAQLCGQAMCLEEQFQCIIEKGYIFYTTDKRRKEVVFSDTLRRITQNAIHDMRALLDEKTVPPALCSSKCRECSLNEGCMPTVKNDSGAYIKMLHAHSLESPKDIGDPEGRFREAESMRGSEGIAPSKTKRRTEP